MRAVAGIAVAVAGALLAVAHRYGWHRDELYFVEAGQHLAWGYVDQPPFTPLVARIADDIASGNLVVLRTLPALATAATVLLAAALVRELGGSARAQVVGAAAVGSGGFVLGVGHLLSTATFDLTAWMAVLWLSARLLRTADARWWVGIGAVSGAAMLNKHLIVLLLGAIVVGLAAERRRDLLLSPWAVVGAVLAVVIASPNLLWQASHGWPQQDMAAALERRIGGENRATLLPLQLLFAGPLLLGTLLAGVRRLWVGLELRPFRPLLWAWPTAVLAVFVSGGRPYYVLPLTLALLCAGFAASGAEPARRTWALVLANGALSIVLALPVLPMSQVDVVAEVNEVAVETIGWPELAAQVAGVVARLPAEDRASVVLLAGTYGEAGALDRFGPAHGLPAGYSPHNGYADFRRPDDDDATVVAVRFAVGDLAPYFRRCEQVDRVDNGRDVDNEVQGAPILVCRGLRQTWSTTWASLRFLS